MNGLTRIIFFLFVPALAAGVSRHGRAKNLLVTRRRVTEDPPPKWQTTDSEGKASPALQRSSRASPAFQLTLSRPPRIVVIGAPCSGKGTLCEQLASLLGVTHISAGDLLRAESKKSGSMSRKIRELIDSGRLVPDGLISQIVAERLNENSVVQTGWLLDGFPRSKEQGFFLLSEGLVPDAIVSLDAPDSILVRRATQRRLDPVTGIIYNLDSRPPPKLILGRCIRRPDDFDDIAIGRVATFRRTANEIKEALGGKIISLDASKSPKDVLNDFINYFSSQKS